ncbi:MAG: rod shape-determining protein MreC [Candidatus Omnitrophica bacterium]|nr:rod shape-determining protein MreC [Candidatus Omnitrophota bacterium]
MLSALILIVLVSNLALSKYLKPAITSLLLPAFKFGESVTSGARQFLNFQDLFNENKRLENQVGQLTAQLAQLQDLELVNQRLRELLSLSKKKSLPTQVALLISRDSSNWTRIVMIDKGTSSGIAPGMPVVSGENLLGKVIEVAPFSSKVSLIVDFNSKVPAKISRTGEQGVAFGALQSGGSVCKMKYIHQAEIGDKVISSGLGKIYPKGLLLGEVVNLEQAKNKLYKVAQIKPAIDFSKLEEVMVITGQ